MTKKKSASLVFLKKEAPTLDRCLSRADETSGTTSVIADGLHLFHIESKSDMDIGMSIQNDDLPDQRQASE